MYKISEGIEDYVVIFFNITNLWGKPECLEYLKDLLDLFELKRYDEKFAIEDLKLLISLYQN